MQFSKLLGVTVLAMASSAQAQDCTKKFAGYMPRTDVVADYWDKDQQQAAFEAIMSSETCADVIQARDEWQGSFGSTVYLQSIPTQTSPISKEWKEYINYYGTDKFHTEWVDAAFTCGTITTWDCDLFEPDFNKAYCDNTGGLDPGTHANPDEVVTDSVTLVDKYCVGVEESVKKATSYVFQFIEIVQLMEKAIRETKTGCNMQDDENNDNTICETAMEFWDGAAAIFTGSLEGETGGLPGIAIEPDPSKRVYGKTLYTLAEKRCRNFMTCGPTLGNGVGPPTSPNRYATASINSKILQFFSSGSHAIYSGDYQRAQFFKRKISAKIMVPWVQGTLRYAHRLSSSRGSPASRTHKEIGEASTFALGALPKLWACSINAVEVVEPFLKTGRDFGPGFEIDFIKVKTAFECNYRCLGITCKEVGELFDGDASVKTNAEICDDTKNLSSDKEVAKCTRPNSRFIQKCRNYGGRSGISGRTNFDYIIDKLDK